MVGLTHYLRRSPTLTRTTPIVSWDPECVFHCELKYEFNPIRPTKVSFVLSPSLWGNFVFKGPSFNTSVILRTLQTCKLEATEIVCINSHLTVSPLRTPLSSTTLYSDLTFDLCLNFPKRTV